MTGQPMAPFSHPVARAQRPTAAPVRAAVPGRPASGRVPHRLREATEGLPYTGIHRRGLFRCRRIRAADASHFPPVLFRARRGGRP